MSRRFADGGEKVRIAALSDIHSNVYALDAVIRDLKLRGVDLMLNLGDILYGPIAPRATFELLREHEFVTIRGNQDRQIYEATNEEIDSNPTMQFILADLGEAPISWMKDLPPEIQLDDDIYLCHGAPKGDTVYLLEDVSHGFPRLRAGYEIVELLGGQESNVIICGHTHIPRTVTIESGQLIVNPGSVGLPAYEDDQPVRHSMESFSPHASYSMIEKSGAGWTVQHVKVAYDFQNAAKEARGRRRDDWAYFLTTGRALESATA
jgi:putative phosphoesterase